MKKLYTKNIESHQLDLLTIFEPFVNFKYVFFSSFSRYNKTPTYDKTRKKKNMHEMKANKRKTMRETNYHV